MIKLNGHEIYVTIFPDKTSQVWKIPQEAFEYDSIELSFGSVTEERIVKRPVLDHKIVWKFEHEAEIIHLAQLKDLIVTGSKKSTVDLHIPFLPYARQDKKVSNDETFAKYTFEKLLASLGFRCITTLDIHSESIPYSFKCIKNIFPSKELDFAFENSKPSLICYPDKGAETRYKDYFGKFPSCSFTKVRNQDTGRIESLLLNELVGIEDETILIVDDLCDGGMTFKLTAERLYELGAKEVHLYVSHGIFSKGLETLRESGIKRIFTKDGEVKEQSKQLADELAAI